MIPDPGNEISITKTIEFHGGTDKIKDESDAESQLNPLIQVLLQNPEIKVYIQGNVGDGDVQGPNWWLNGKLVSPIKLMTARGRAIYNFLKEKGVPEAQLMKPGPGEIHKGSQYDLTITIKNEGKK